MKLDINQRKHCDICEKKIVKDYIFLPVRSRDCRVWSWYEGHEKCLLKMKRDPKLIYGKPQKKRTGK